MHIITMYLDYGIFLSSLTENINFVFVSIFYIERKSKNNLPFFKNIKVYASAQETILYFLHRQESKAQTSLRTRAVSPEPSFFSYTKYFIVCLFVFVALRPMSTAMVIAGQSVHLTTLFPGQA